MSGSAQPHLFFSRSQSQALGVQSGLTPMLKRYAPRVVSLLKMGSYGGILSSGLAAGSFLFVGAGLALLGSAAIMILYGDKEKQKARAEQVAASGEASASDPVSGVLLGVGKIFSPSAHPVESASALSLLASGLILLQGILSANPYFIGIGVCGAIASAIALFGHERSKTDASRRGLNFQQSSSQTVGLGESKGLVQSLKGNPVRVSAILLMITGSLSLAGGIAADDLFLIGAGVCSMVANVLMALFVKKNDYNVDAIKQTQMQPTPRTQVTEKNLLPPLQPSPGLALA